MFSKIKENIELIIIGLIAVGVAILDIVSVTDQGVTSAAILAVLAIMAFSGISDRKNVNELKEVIHNLNRKIETISNRETLINFGIIGHFKNRPNDLLKEKYEKATKQIKILHTWLDAVEPLPIEIFEAEKRGVAVKIILLDPDSYFAKMRAKNLGFEENTTRTRVLFEGVENAIRKNCQKDNFIEVFLYDGNIPFSYYAVDNWGLVGLFWAERAGVIGPHIEVIEKEKGIAFFLNETFNKILEKSKKVAFQSLSQ